jgi:hypothetical protein
MAAVQQSGVRQCRSFRDFWIESVMLSNTLIGRDKSMRAWQYTARMLYGLTGKELFGNLLRTLALSRKTLRFYKPVKVAKAIDDILGDENLDSVDKALTVAEVSSDGIYALTDHVAFAQRLGALPWLSARDVDNLDRFIEVFWVTEIVAVMCRELRTFGRLRLQELGAKVRGKPSLKEGSPRVARVASETLVSPMAAYPSSASVKDEEMPATRPSSNALAAKRRLNLILLFKAIMCDLPVALYFLFPAAVKNRGRNRACAGFCGLIASLISLHLNWPKKD